MRILRLGATVVALVWSVWSYGQELSYRLNATGQTICYDDRGKVLKKLSDGDALYGQDANYMSGVEMLFKDNKDGTISDLNTGLMWQRVPPAEGMTWAKAKEYCEALELGGYSDWRMPTLKELFSISNFETGWPYLDTKFFNLSNGEVTKDEQYWADNKYVGETVEGGDDAAFGVNHVTGHIKAYPAGSKMRAGGEGRPPMPEGGQGRAGSMPPPPQGGGGRPGGAPGGGHPAGGGRPRGNPMAKQVRAVRGDIYGINKFVDNGDGTISDTATGLMWSKSDNGNAVEWIEALPYAKAATLAGHSDWRLPNVKELQSIVDYTRAPSSKGVEAAIDPIFSCTPFINEAGADDYGYYWTSTSACFTRGRPFHFAWYVAFGRAVNNNGADFHGAGAVRFDSKANNGIAVEGGEERYYNFVRLVRNISIK